MKLFLILFILLLINTSLLGGDYSSEAGFIQRNRVPIERIRRFYNADYPEAEKKWVAYTLIRYRTSEAVVFFKEHLNHTDTFYQANIIMPMIHAGEFVQGFQKFKELSSQNSDELFTTFYQPMWEGYRSDLTLYLYRKYKRKFIPFLKELALDSSRSFMIRVGAAQTLFYLDEKQLAHAVLLEIGSTPIPQDDFWIKMRSDSFDEHTEREIKRARRILKREFDSFYTPPL